MQRNMMQTYKCPLAGQAETCINLSVQIKFRPPRAFLSVTGDKRASVIITSRDPKECAIVRIHDCENVIKQRRRFLT